MRFLKHHIITISRQFGSGGRTIGKELAQKLGIPCYDNELIEKLAAESGFNKEYIEECSEYTSHSNWFVNAFSTSRSSYPSNQDYLWNAQRKIITELSEQGPCVIVGRCADYILRDKADCLRVFIHASMEQRAERIVTRYGESAESPEKRLRDKDKRRSAYYRFYTDMEWGNAENYHISLDSGALGINTCVDILAMLYLQHTGS